MLKTCLILLTTIFSLCQCSNSDVRKGTTTNDTTFTLIFTGDVLLDRGVRPVIEKNGIKYLFTNVETLFKQADATVINLECPLSDEATPIFKQFVFRADTHFANGLREVGITHAALANNHTNDQGYKGLSSTINTLIENKIAPIGIDSIHGEIRPTLIKKNSMEVVVFNSVTVPLENWGYDKEKLNINQYNGSEVAKAIKKYKILHPKHHIVALLHWGHEFRHQPSLQQRVEAKMMIEAGADAIIGHHPHVIQTIDTINGKPVIYSLGNFVFDQHLPQARQCLVAELSFSPSSSSFNIHHATIDRCRPRIDK